MHIFKKLSKLKFLRLIVATSCVAIFVYMSVEQYEVFADEPTGSSLTRQSLPSMAFPAVSVCDSHFELRKAFEEIGVPISPFARRVKKVTSNPTTLYRQLDYLDLDIMPNLWKYYFTLDKIIRERDEYPTDDDMGIDHRCRIGAVSCGINHQSDIYIPEDPYNMQQVEIEVPAGRWTSRLMADSLTGSTYMCHTLVPNVTVDFSGTFGNSISIVWRMNTFSNMSTFWRVYVHDRKENVLLNSFAMDTVASVTLMQSDPSDENSVKRKMQIVPRLTRHPPASAILPCRDDSDYSENMCNIAHGWRTRLQEMAEYYKRENFTCVIPGIITDVSKMKEKSWYLSLPVCNHYEAEPSNNFTMGMHDLTREFFNNLNKRPLLGEPPIGIYQSTSGCVRRCSGFHYTLVEEPASMYDTELEASDLYLYFASPMVKVWREYRLMSTLDFLVGVGGAVGLILGMSILSMVTSLLEIVFYLGETAFKSNKRGRDPSQK